MIKARILIVEDETIIAMDLKSRLEVYGYQVVDMVGNGEDALRQVYLQHPDLLLMDIVLQGKMDGIQVAELVRPLAIPVIFLTAYSDDATFQRAAQTAPYGYLLKPYEDRELNTAIELALFKHGMEKKLQESEARFHSIYDQSPIAIELYNPDGDLEESNPATLRLFGLEDAYDLSRLNLFADPLFPEWVKEKVRMGDTVRFETSVDFDTLMARGPYELTKTGLTYLDILITPWGIASEPQRGFLVHLNDITARKGAEERLRYDTLHDALTGLPNRTYFIEELKHALGRTRRHREYRAAVLFLDLDRFKIINDSLGHAWGDQYLRSVARRLEICLRPEDTISRFGGDEFAVLLQDIEGLGDATRIADRIQQALSQAVEIEGHAVSSSASIGIALVTPEYTNSDELLRDADTAMYRAKGSGKAHYEIFDSEMHAEILEMLQLESELRQALEGDQFSLFYQPIAMLADGMITGVEALLRWRHPRRGLLTPEAFHQLAEETGLAVPLGAWQLRSACAQAFQWQQAGLPPVVVSVALSPRQLQHPVLPAMIYDILTSIGLEPGRLAVEISELAAMANYDAAGKVLQALNEIGVQVVLGGFGAAYSSFGLLRRFPLRAIKIDPSLMNQRQESEHQDSIIEAMIAMGHVLGLTMVAEGVESEPQMALLRAQHCDQVQGGIISPPIPAEEISAYLTSHNQKSE